MCPPILVAAASLAGTALSAAGAIQQGNAQKAAADAQAAAYNRQASLALQQGEYQAGRTQNEIDKVIGMQVASVAGSGINLNGSPSDVIATTASNGALATSADRFNARIQANNDMYQAALVKQSGEAAKQAGTINAIGGVIGGLSKFGGGGGFTTLGNAFGMNGSEAARQAWTLF